MQPHAESDYVPYFPTSKSYQRQSYFHISSIIGPFSVSKEMCSDEIKASTPISFFLPAKSGLGRCALALNNFLISLHNDFVGRCKTLLNDESR